MARQLIIRALLALCFVVLGASAALAQSTAPPNPNYTTFNTRSAGQTPTPGLSTRVSLYYDGTGFFYKKSDGTSVAVGGGGGGGTVSGTPGKIPVFTGATAVGDGSLFDTGSLVHTGSVFRIDTGGAYRLRNYADTYDIDFAHMISGEIMQLGEDPGSTAAKAMRLSAGVSASAGSTGTFVFGDWSGDVLLVDVAGNSRIGVSSGTQYTFSSTDASTASTADTGVARRGAADIKATNGSTGLGSFSAGTFKVLGSTSGVITLQGTGATVGTYSITLPTAVPGANATPLLMSTGGVISYPTGTPDGTKFLRDDGAWTVPTASASAAGSDTQVQYNSSGSFAGNAGLTFSATNKALTVGGATVTTSNPVLDVSQAWNASGVTFTLIKGNVTADTSAAVSKLIDLQDVGVSKFSVDKAGTATALGVTALSGSTLTITGGSNTLTINGATASTMKLLAGSSQTLVLGANGNSYWSVDSSTGAFLPVNASVVDIGSTGARAKYLYLGGTTVGSSAPVIDITQTWNASTQFVAFNLNISNSASTANSIFFNAQLGGTSGWNVQRTGIMETQSTGGLEWSASSDANSASPDLTLLRPSAAAAVLTGTDTATAAALSVLTLDHESSGTPAASYGTSIAFSGKSSTTASQDMASVQAIWTTATHASRTSALVFNAVNNAAAIAEVGRISGSGRLTLGSGGTAYGIEMPLTGAIDFINNGTAKVRYHSGSGTLQLASTETLSWQSGAVGTAMGDVALQREGAAILQLGPDAAAPVSYTLKSDDARSGTDTDTAGSSLTIAAGRGTGTGGGGSLVFQTAPAGSTGTTANTLTTAFTITNTQRLRGIDGSSSSPTYAFTNATNYGVYYDGTASLMLSAGGGTTAITLNGSGGNASINRVFSFKRTASTNSGSVSLDMKLGNVYEVTLSGNITSLTLTTPQAGTYYTIAFIQDATGSRTVTWPSTMKFAGGTTPTLTPTAGAKDVLTFYSDGTNLYAVAPPQLDVK